MTDRLPLPEIPNALTPEEWVVGYYDSRELEIRVKTPGLDGSKRLHVNVRAWPLGGTMGDPRDLHALAALCLHGQPFGFTHEECDELRRAITFGEEAWCDSVILNEQSVAVFRSILAKVAALLPPTP